MMNKHIRGMIDEIFSDMKMTAENLALRDELMANAQARYEDAMAQGMTEDQAFADVAASLGDVQALLDEINGKPDAHKAPQSEPEYSAPEENAEHDEQKQTEELPKTDLGDALNKAFAALGDFGQAILPEAKKFVRQMDDVTGGMIKDIGKAAKKGLRDAQKAAEETIDRLSGEKGELIFDCGPKEKAEKPADDVSAKVEQLRKEAADLRAEAGLKQVIGDQTAADEKNARVASLEAQADMLEQEQAVEAAHRAAQEAAEAARKEAETDLKEQDEALAEDKQEEMQPEPEDKPELTDENGEVNEDVLARAVEDIAREAQEAVRQAAETVKSAVDETVRPSADAEYTVRDASEPVSGRRLFPAAGLHKIDIHLDADDVTIEPAQGSEIETLWEAQNVDGEPAFEMDGHTLSLRRKNPDAFKTFFSVFKKEGGRITVRVPMGYAACYHVTTTSGDIVLRGLDVDEVKATTTAGDVRVEPKATVRADAISVTTVSGHAAVSACANDVAVTTVSGNQFVSCDAHKVDVNVVSGKVHVEGACDEWEVDAVSSDVELLCTVAPTKKVQISSMYGTVRLALPDEIRGFVAETSGMFGCSITNEFGSNRYGTCALPIRMDTMRGQLMITRL